MRVVVVAEFYPRGDDPVQGIWAHRQALAARAAGADVRVLVLHRLVPARAALASRDARALSAPLRQPLHTRLDGLDVHYVPFISPPFSARSYAAWGAWAAPSLGLSLGRLRRAFPFELIHAHYAVPAGDAVRRTRSRAPLVLSVHGGDVLFTAPGSARGERAVKRAFARARLVIANAGGTEQRCQALGAHATRVVHLGTDLPTAPAAPASQPTVVSVGHLVARKRHGDVLRALALLRDRRPELRYLLIGDGPERPRLEALAGELRIADRVTLRGALPHSQALAEARRCTLFALPSVDEAFGVAYIEAMAGWLPAIGCRGESGPEEIAALGEGMLLVEPGDIEALAAQIERSVAEPAWRAKLGESARATVERHFTWERCGEQTIAAYEAALR